MAVVVVNGVGLIVASTHAFSVAVAIAVATIAISRLDFLVT